MQIPKQMTVMEKLQILSDAAKYDVACTSSGVDRKGNGHGMGNCIARHLSYIFGGRKMRFPVKDPFYQRMYLQLFLLPEQLHE